MATVDDLLRTLHRQAASLRPTGQPDRQLPAYLRGWVPLSANACRVLDALDPRPEHRELYGLLQALGWAGAGQPSRADGGVDRLAVTVGVLADAIVSFPETVAQAGQAQRSRLQTSIQAALHATARTTLDIARDARQGRVAEIVRKIAEITEPAAMLPPLARISTLERLTVTRLTPDTADGAVQLWAGVANHTFTNHRLVTGVALQDAAATLALLCQIASDTLAEAARRHILDPDRARGAARLASDASSAWRKVANWPTNIQLGGRAYEHQQAVRAVRETLTGPPLTRLTLRERVHTLRAAVSTAVTIGELQAATVARVASHGGLWIAHERPNLRPPGVERRHIKYDWEIMDSGHPAARVLADRGQAAQQALAAAAEATNQAVLPSAALHGETGRITLVDDRIVAGWWETVEPAARARKPEDCDAMKSQAVSRRIER